MNFIYKTLAKEIIEEMCRFYDISPENEEIIYEILEEIATDQGLKNEDIPRQMERIKDNPQKDEMFKVFIAIAFKIAKISAKKPKPS